MSRRLDAAALEAAILGGLVLSAGGSGTAAVATNRKMGELALGYGAVELVASDELRDSDAIVIATAVGAPGFSTAKRVPRFSVEAAEAVIAATGRRPAAVMPGHVPGLYAWLQAAVLGIKLLDAATNGRGHPTVKMGAMGLASDPAALVTQAGVGGDPDAGTSLRIVVTGNIVQTSNLMRQAAVQNGGTILAARGLFEVGFVRRSGAPGAIGFQLGLGEAMRGKQGRGRLDAALEFTRGRLLGEGRVARNDCRLDGGFDLGTVDVQDRAGTLRLGVCNEWMTAERDGERLATFPDLIASLDPETGEALAISELAPGRAVAVIAASKRHFPIGAGARDPAVYPEVEEKMGVALARWALDPEA